MTSPDYRPTERATPSMQSTSLPDHYADLFGMGDPGWQDLTVDTTRWPIGTVETIGWRDMDGWVRGFIMYFVDPPPPSSHGDLYFWVHSRFRGMGIGKALLQRAFDRWDIKVEGQRYTPDGAGVVNQFVARKRAERLERERLECGDSQTTEGS